MILIKCRNVLRQLFRIVVAILIDFDNLEIGSMTLTLFSLYMSLPVGFNFRDIRKKLSIKIATSLDRNNAVYINRFIDC